MARSYAVVGNATNTQSSTLPLMTVISAATVRPKIYEIDLGSDASPADNAGKYVFQRCTSAGTPGSSYTPVPIDPADPASLSSSGLAVFSVGPTLTANAFVWEQALNQRASFRWIANTGKELVMPATAANGLALMPTVTTTAFNVVWTVFFEE